MNDQELQQLTRVLEEIRDNQKIQLERQAEALTMQREQFSLVQKQSERTERIQDRAEQIQAKSAQLVAGSRKAMAVVLTIILSHPLPVVDPFSLDGALTKPLSPYGGLNGCLWLIQQNKGALPFKLPSPLTDKEAHMKHYLLLPHLLLLAVSASAHALDGQGCLAQSAGLSGQEHTTFLVGCLAKASAPANVELVAQQNRHQRCERNAENLKLRGDNATAYTHSCMNKNEAKEAWDRYAQRHDSSVFASNAEH